MDSRHAHYLEQYYNGQANKGIPFLNRIGKKMRLEMKKTNTITSQARIERYRAFTEQMTGAEFSGCNDNIRNKLEAV